uniref:RING-type E3 ubiquitin transferase n=1 Tax=Oryza rufipogon TaxID=4529 RepID=A0A0E0QB31_ORYRU
MRGGGGGDAGTSSRGGGSGGAPARPRRFPEAAQPEIMRAAEKDDGYAAHVTEACRDAFRHLFGTRVAVAYQNEIKLLGQSLYYLLTTGSGQQTLGEEYCDISQVATSHGLPPTPARRILFILYQTTVPYLAERISSRIVARGIALEDSQLDDHSESDSSSIGTAAQPSPIRNSPSRSLSFSHLSRLRGRVHTLWEWVLRKWPSDCIIIYQSEQLAFVIYVFSVLKGFEEQVTMEYLQTTTPSIPTCFIFIFPTSITSPTAPAQVAVSEISFRF